MRWKLLTIWLGGTALFAILAQLGLTPAQEQPAKSATVQPKTGAQLRQAKRPRSLGIQTDLNLAKKTKVEFRDAAELAFKDFNELVLKTGIFESQHAAELGVPRKFELLCYNGQPVGPTIRVRRGTTFHIRVKNDLPATQPDKPHPPNGSNEQPHDLCTTNLHTHGLHVSPADNADNIFVSIEPQKERTFEFTIPADHPAGTFWYHPHHHGSVAYQLSNGLAGALIVEGSRRDGIADLEDIPEIAAAKERILLLQLLNYRIDPPGKEGVARIDATTIYDIRPDKRSCPAISIPDQDAKPEDKGQATAINGLINPIIKIAPGEVQRWRMIHGAWDVNRNLYLGDKDGNPATDINFHEIALDGLATGTMVAKGNVFKPDDPNTLPTVELAPGQRSDVLLQAPLLGEKEPNREYYLMQSPQDPSAKENLILAKVIVSGKRRHMRLPDSRALAKCQPFASIRDEELAKSNTSEIASKGLTFVATTTAPEKFWLNKKTFSMYDSPIQIRVNTAEEWKVTAAAAEHPFHIHVNAFQVVMRKDAKGNVTPMNVWRDTLFIREGETYTIRSRFQDFLGQTVIHCHLLDHEDQGMMMPIEFIPPYQVPKPAKVRASAGLKPTSIRAPDLKLADSAGASHELGKLQGRKVLLVFFRGMECAHCTEQLAKLVGRDGLGPDAEVEIVAVSSSRITNEGRALKTLGVAAADRFHLLVDNNGQAFRAFGCYQDGPLHGLFLIDRSGMIRASYTGESPFSDTEEVARQFKTLGNAGASR